MQDKENAKKGQSKSIIKIDDIEVDPNERYLRTYNYEH